MKVTIENLKKNGLEVYSYEDIMIQNGPDDEEILNEMDRVGADILLFNSHTAHYWFFEDEDSMLKYFENGAKVGVENHNQLVESLDEFDIEWNKRFGNTVGKPMTKEEHHEFMEQVKAFAEEWHNR